MQKRVVIIIQHTQLMHVVAESFVTSLQGKIERKMGEGKKGEGKKG